jgi:hypothetical protein
MVIIIISSYVSAICLFALAIMNFSLSRQAYKTHKTKVANATETTGILLGFANARSRRNHPIIECILNGEKVVKEAIYPSATLSEYDIEKTIKLRYTKGLSVFVCDEKSLQELAKNRKRLLHKTYIGVAVCLVFTVIMLTIAGYAQREAEAADARQRFAAENSASDTRYVTMLVGKETKDIWIKQKPNTH